MDLLGETPAYYIFNCASVVNVKRNHRCFGDFLNVAEEHHEASLIFSEAQSFLCP